MLNRLTRTPLSPQEAEALLDRLASHIYRCTSPEEVIVFGSAARGELTDGSDVDIAVVFSSEPECTAGKKALLTQPNPTGWPVDYLFFSRESFDEKKKAGGICETIAQEGRRLSKKQVPS